MLTKALFIAPEKTYLLGVKATLFSHAGRHVNKNQVKDCAVQEHLETTSIKKSI